MYGDESMRFPNKWYQSQGSSLIMLVDAKQNGVVSSEPLTDGASRKDVCLNAMKDKEIQV